MQYAHLVYNYKFHSGNYAPGSVNLGDYVQTLAADAFLPRVDVEVDRDQLSVPLTEQTKLIANGWYCLHDRCHLFSSQLSPLLISMHVSELSCGNPMSKSLTRIKDLAEIRPVGCRDHYTLEFFQGHGIPAYFSGCLTLTLQRERFSSQAERSGIVIVDCPYISPNRKFRFFPLNRWLKLRRARREVCEIVDSFISLTDSNVAFHSHTAEISTTHKQRFAKARALLEAYANAQVVITSRLHCALPCLAMGTPVIYIGLYDCCRFQGLGELVNHIFIDKRGRVKEVEIMIDNANNLVNPSDHLQLSKALSQTCHNFMQNRE